MAAKINVVEELKYMDILQLVKLFSVKLGSCPKSVPIFYVLGPTNFIGEKHPKFLTQLLNHTDFLNMAKFGGNRLRDLRDYAFKIEEAQTIAAKYNTPRQYTYRWVEA